MKLKIFALFSVVFFSLASIGYAADELTTGIAPLDGAVKLFLRILGVIFLAVMGKNLLTMFIKHEYAKLIPWLIFSVIVGWVLLDMESFVRTFKALISGVSGNVGGNGTGGAGGGK